MSAPMSPEEFAERHITRGGTAKRQHDGSYMVDCHAHEDRTPSLHVSVGRDGRLLFHCHAGCPQVDVLLAEDLDWRDVFGEERNGDGIVATHGYHDADGHLLGQIVRKADGGKVARRPGGAEQWIWDWKGVPRVLYRLPEVLRAIAAGGVIHFCEGEKDADALVGVGEVATTAPFGAGAKWEEAYSDALRGADVIVWRDRDEAGRKRGAKVIEALQGVATRTLLVEAREGNDPADHLRAGHGAWDFVKVKPVDERLSTAGKFTIRGIDLAKLRPVDFLWKPWLVRGRLNLLVGEESSGKSTLQRWMIARLTCGELAGAFQNERPRVLWVGADEDDWHSVIAPGLYAQGARLDAIHEFVAVDDLAIFNIVDHIEELRREVQVGEFPLVVVEQLLDVMPAMKNTVDPMEVRRALRPLRRMLAATEVTALGTFHVNKAQADQLRQRMQGSVQYNALSRSTLFVDRHPTEPDRRIAVLGKANYVKDDTTAMSFQIDSARFDLNGYEFDVGRVVDVQDDDTPLSEVLGGRRERGSSKRDEVAERISQAMYEVSRVALPIGDATRDTPSWGLRELARLVDTNVRTVGRALENLAARGLVTQGDDKRWRLAEAQSNGAAPQPAIFDYDDEEGC